MHYFYREMDFRETEKPTLVQTKKLALYPLRGKLLAP